MKDNKIPEAQYPDPDTIMNEYSESGYYTIYCPHCNRAYPIEIDCNENIQCECGKELHVSLIV